MKHTPGPWSWKAVRDAENNPLTVRGMKALLSAIVDKTVQHGDSVEDFYLVLSSDDPKDPVCSAITLNGPTAKANARLIAKAPELEEQRDALLAACKMALKRTPFPVGAMRAKQMLEDAVTKTEGA